MSSLSNIRGRLRAVENIEQIATSMEMVATARFRKAQEKAKQTQFYILKMREILGKIQAASNDISHPLLVQRKGAKIGLVIITSDRGLCGSYNANILAAAEDFLKDKDPENVELILLGRKAHHYYQKKRWKIYSELTEWSGKMTLSQVKELNDRLINGFLSGELDVVWLLYTKFYTLMHREIVLEKFLPIEKPKEKSKEVFNYLLEPGPEEIYPEILSRFCMVKIETMLNEAYASELAARIFSMKAAAKNAEEMLEQLTLERNKMRQAGITREILETIAATMDA